MQTNPENNTPAEETTNARKILEQVDNYAAAFPPPPVEPGLKTGVEAPGNFEEKTLFGAIGGGTPLIQTSEPWKLAKVTEDLLMTCGKAFTIKAKACATRWLQLDPDQRRIEMDQLRVSNFGLCVAARRVFDEWRAGSTEKTGDFEPQAMFSGFDRDTPLVRLGRTRDMALRWLKMSWRERNAEMLACRAESFEFFEAAVREFEAMCYTLEKTSVATSAFETAVAGEEIPFVSTSDQDFYLRMIDQLLEEEAGKIWTREDLRQHVSAGLRLQQFEYLKSGVLPSTFINHVVQKTYDAGRGRLADLAAENSGCDSPAPKTHADKLSSTAGASDEVSGGNKIETPGEMGDGTAGTSDEVSGENKSGTPGLAIGSTAGTSDEVSGGKEMQTASEGMGSTAGTSDEVVGGKQIETPGRVVQPATGTSDEVSGGNKMENAGMAIDATTAASDEVVSGKEIETTGKTVAIAGGAPTTPGKFDIAMFQLPVRVTAGCWKRCVELFGGLPLVGTAWVDATLSAQVLLEKEEDFEKVAASFQRFRRDHSAEARIVLRKPGVEESAADLRRPMFGVLHDFGSGITAEAWLLKTAGFVGGFPVEVSAWREDGECVVKRLDKKEDFSAMLLTLRSALKRLELCVFAVRKVDDATPVQMVAAVTGASGGGAGEVVGENTTGGTGLAGGAGKDSLPGGKIPKKPAQEDGGGETPVLVTHGPDNFFTGYIEASWLRTELTQDYFIQQIFARLGGFPVALVVDEIASGLLLPLFAGIVKSGAELKDELNEAFKLTGKDSVVSVMCKRKAAGAEGGGETPANKNGGAYPEGCEVVGNSACGIVDGKPASHAWGVRPSLLIQPAFQDYLAANEVMALGGFPVRVDVSACFTGGRHVWLKRAVARDVEDLRVALKAAHGGKTFGTDARMKIVFTKVDENGGDEGGETTQQDEGPDFGDGHDWEGFAGGCERFGCAPGCTPPSALDLWKQNAQPHMLRVLQEYLDLDDKCQKLLKFTSSPVFETLPIEERGNLYAQHDPMRQYADILLQRLQFAGFDLSMLQAMKPNAVFSYTRASLRQRSHLETLFTDVKVDAPQVDQKEKEADKISNPPPSSSTL